MQTIFSVTAKADRAEGRGESINTGFGFTNFESALAFVQGKAYAQKFGIMNHTGDENDIVQIKVYNKTQDAEAQMIEQLLQRTLDGLSDAQIEVLKAYFTK